MKTFTKVFLGTVAVVAVAAGVAHAQGYRWSDARGGRMAERMFDRLDTNKDGAVSIDEAMKIVDDRFDAVDTNKDGFVDAAEIKAAMAKRAPRFAERRGERMAERAMAAFDVDKDGKISKAEAEKPFRKRFALFDQNDDGKVTKDEALAAMAFMHMGPGFGPGFGRGMEPGMGPGMGHGMGPGTGPGMGPGMRPGQGPRGGMMQPPPPAEPNHTMNWGAPVIGPQRGAQPAMWRDARPVPVQVADSGPFEWRMLGDENAASRDLDFLDGSFDEAE